MSGVGVAKVAQILDLCNFIPQMELKGHRIMIRDVNRPALQLSGYFEHFEQSRVQIIGTVEYPIPLSAPGNRSISPHRK